jgi:Uncharacterized conserved protein
LAVAAISIAACTHSPLQLAGGGSDTEVSGRIVSVDNVAVKGAVVSLVNISYNPAFDGPLPAEMQVTTDSLGNFRFDSLTPGPYNLQAAQSDDGTKILVASIFADSGKSKNISDVTLKKTATLIVPLPDSLSIYSGFLYVPGTLLWKTVAINSRSVEFDSIPQGTLSSIQFQKTKTDPAIVLFSNVIIASSDTIILDPFTAWAHLAKIMLNTSATGANINKPVFNFPILVRLNSTNFTFSQAKQNGEDLRIVRPDNSPVSFEIEQWDSSNASASVWVKVDTIPGNTSGQYLSMFWGNPNAKTKSNPAAVFDTAIGFQGVWHLGESGGTTQKDATSNKFDGTPEAMSGSSDVTGIIARAQDFDGSSQCVSVLNARNSRLDVQTDSFYTVSSWVFARTLNNGLHVFLSKGSAQYGLMINKANRWEFYGGLPGYGVDTTTTAPAVANAWTLVTGIRNGMKQYLYVNGVLVDSTLSAAGTSPGISNNFYDLVIGRQSDDQSQWFDGIIDESRVESIARSAGWTKLCFQNQRSDQVLVQIVPVK